MFPHEIPEYTGPITSEKAFIPVVVEEYSNVGEIGYNTKRLSLKALQSTEYGNLATIDKVGTNYPVPTDGVLAGYMDRNGVPRLATKDGHQSQFLLVGTDYINSDEYLIASPGIVRLPGAGHNYIVGKTYYLGTDGNVSTTEGSQRLFSVIDKSRIIVY